MDSAVRPFEPRHGDAHAPCLPVEARGDFTARRHPSLILPLAPLDPEARMEHRPFDFERLEWRYLGGSMDILLVGGVDRVLRDQLRHQTTAGPEFGEFRIWSPVVSRVPFG